MVKRVQVNFKIKDIERIEEYMNLYGYLSRQHFFQCVLRQVFINRDAFVVYCRQKVGYEPYRDYHAVKVLLNMTEKDEEFLSFFINKLAKNRAKNTIAWQRGEVYALACSFIFGEGELKS